jgi:hypothetical protein
MHLPTGATEASVLPGHATPSLCKNCGTRFEGRFCPACGQKADTHRITWHFIWHEIPHSVWHVDHGILFTLRELFTRPGYTIREFLEGKRVRHYRPLALVLILGTVLTFLQHSLSVSLIEESNKAIQSVTGTAEAESERLRQFQTQMYGYVERYFHLITIFTLPITAFFTWLCFRKKSLNYPEHLVANTFLANVSLVLSIFSVLLYKLTGSSSQGFSAIQVLTTGAVFGYSMWAFAQLFHREMKPWVAAWRSALAHLLAMFAAMLVGAFAVGVYLAFVYLPQHPKPEKPSNSSATHAPLPQK